MAEDVTPGSPAHQHLLYQHSSLIRRQEEGVLQWPSPAPHTRPHPLPVVQNPQLQEDHHHHHHHRQKPHNPLPPPEAAAAASDASTPYPQGSNVLLEGEQEINLSPVYEHPPSLHGPPIARTYHCSQCFKSTDSPREHLHHLVKEHGLDLAIYECALCDYATKYKQKLAHHHSSYHCSTSRSANATSVLEKTLRTSPHCTPNDMLGSSAVEDDGYGYSRRFTVGVDDKRSTPFNIDRQRMKDVNENVKWQYYDRKSTEPDLICMEKMDVAKRSATMANTEDQDLLCNESVANDSAEFELKPTQSKAPMREDDDGGHLVIDFGDNLNRNRNNNNVNSTPAILKAVSLATAHSMAAQPTMVPVTLSVKRDVLDTRPNPTPVVTSAATKLTKKGTVPVREAVDPAKYVRLQDVDGVRYACSKCGNVYKWRKSLNKHWKEKHDGEIPVPASGSFNILNIPHIKGGSTPQYSTPKSSTTSSRTLITPSMLTSSGAISSYALDKYIVDMGAQSGGRSIQASSFPSNSSSAAAAAAAAVLATRSMLSPGFNSMMHPASIPFSHLPAKQPSLNSMRFMKPEVTATANVISKFSNFSGLPTYSHDKMRLPTQLPPPAAHAQNLLKHDLQEKDSSDDMPLDLSKKSTLAMCVTNLTSASPSLSSSRPGSSTMGDQPLDFSVKSNPGSERSTPIHTGRSSRVNMDTDDQLDHQPWMRTASTPDSDIYSNLQCYKCPFVASDKGSFEEHLEQHTNYSQNPQCAQCKQHFSSNNELTQHFGIHHLPILNHIDRADGESGDGQDAGPVSVSTPEAGGQLYLYLTKSRESQEEQCVVCNAKFPRQSDLARHFTHLHPDLPNPYSKKRSLEAESSESEPWHKVSKFEQYGSNEGKQGTTEGELECEQCSFVARDIAEMARHQLVHSFNRPHACTMCGFSSKSRDELQSHMWKYHPTQAEELALMAASGEATPVSLTKAKISSMGNSEENLNQNAADTSGSSAHSGEFGSDDVIIVTPNTTEVPLVRGRKIGKGGTSSAEILLPYKCSVCEYRARWPSEITQHMKNHSDEKPYHCPRCTYKSKWKWDVVKHLKRCGGGTVKDVIDTSRHHRKSDTEDTSSSMSNQSVVKQLQFRNSSPKQTTLSNGPPNVTVLPSSSPGHMGSQEGLGSYSPTSLSSEVMNYTCNVSSPTNSISPEPGSLNAGIDCGEFVKARNQVCDSLSNEGLYHCLQCPFDANSPAELKRHCRVHSDEKPFTCQTCGYSSKWKCDLKKHVRTYNHRPAPRSHDGLDLDDDDKAKDESGKFLSGDEEILSSSDEMTVVTPIQVKPCSVSPLESPTPKPTLYKCDKCQYVTYKKNFLDGHMKIHRTTHEKSGKLKCKQCDYNASDLPSFLQHKLTHSTHHASDMASTLVTADIIPVNMDSRVRVETSPQRHRRKPMKYLTCCKCPYNCLHQTRLDIHESLHKPRGVGSLTCKFCDYNVHNQALLHQHMKLHPDYDSWYNSRTHPLDDALLAESESVVMNDAELEESLQAFATTGDDAVKLNSKNGSGGMKLMLANPAESGEGFQCSKCTFCCESHVQFESHIRQHGSHQPYLCEYCDWSVDRLNTLYKHVREVHPHQLTLRESSDGNNTSREGTPAAEEKKTEGSNSHRKPAARAETCADCGYISDNYVKMTAHKLKHKFESIKKCHYCSETMVTSSQMLEHLSVVHDVNAMSVEEHRVKLALDNQKRTRSQSSSMGDYSSRQLIDVKGQQVYLLHNGNRKVFACPMCSYRTNNSSHCGTHVQQHGSNRKYTCEYCDYSLEQLSHIFHHMKMCHSNEIDTSDTETEAPVEKTLKRGAGGTHPAERLVCSRCPYSTKSGEMFQRHKDWHAYNGQFKCTQCDYSVDTKNLLQEHLPVHMNNNAPSKRRVLSAITSQQRKVVYKPVLQKAATPTPAGKGRRKIRYRCAKCPYSTACKSNIIKHHKLHMVSSKYKCPQCDYSVRRYFLLKQHLRFHGKDDTNEKGGYTKVYLDAGELSTEGTNGKKFTKSDTVLNCGECPFCTYNVVKMKKHRQLHGAKKRFRCNYCTFSHAGRRQIDQHKLLHSDQAGFIVSPDLKRLFRKMPSTKSSMLPKLRIVIKPATNKIVRRDAASKKPYKCKWCPFTCNMRQSYQSHKRQHGSVGSYQCKYCSYSVGRASLLHQHTQLHEASRASARSFGKKRLRCRKCPYHAHSKPLLDLHFRMHRCKRLELSDCETRLGYKCECCPYQTNSKSNFENHKEQHEVSSKLDCLYCDYSSSLTTQIGTQIKLHRPGEKLEAPVLQGLISRAKRSADVAPSLDHALGLDNTDSGTMTDGLAELSNNNNKDICILEATCQYCERNFSDEAAKNRHEQQHLIGVSSS